MPKRTRYGFSRVAAYQNRSRLKIHKVDKTDFYKALSFRKENGFWNPAVLPVSTACGLEASFINWNWNKTTCGLCLSKQSGGVRDE